MSNPILTFNSICRLGISLVCFTIALVFLRTPVLASDTSQELLNALARLNVQLGYGDTAEGWRRFLQLNKLESQAAKGEQADLKTLTELHDLLASTSESAQFRPFDDVRVALENQIRVLSSARQRNLSDLLAQATEEFRPITISMMEYQKDLVKHEIVSLKSFQAAQPANAKRQQAYDSLKLEELETLLNEIEFELAPEVSEGKLNSSIQELRQQLRRVVEQIDALPDEPESVPTPDTDPTEPRDTTQPRPTDDDLATLQAKERALNAEINELNAKRNEIRRADLPRKRQRVDFLRRLFEMEERFTKVKYELGDPYTVSLHFALEKFSRLYGFGTEDNLQEEYLKRIERLVDDLKRLEDPNDRRAFGIVGNSLEWLEHASQAPALVTAIRNRHSYPNAYLLISGQFLNRLGARPVSQTRSVNEEVNGKPLRGVAHTSGTVTFDLVDDPDQAHISIRNMNQIFSDARLEQGLINVFIQTNGQAEARRSIVANIGGLHQDAPYGAANMDSKFCGTSSQCNIINRVAAKKFAEGKPEGDVRAASRVRKELLQRFGEETDKALEDGKKSLGNIRATGLNFFSVMPALYLHTTSDRLNLIGKQHTRWNLAAPNLPPDSGHRNDIDFRIHDSLLSNFIEPIFRGKTYTNEELAQELKNLLKSETNPLAPVNEDAKPANEEPFSITFSNVRPVQFEIDRNRIAVVVSATRFTRGDRTINAGLTITIRFQIIEEDGKLFLTRDGKAELDYIEGQEKNAELVAFRSLLAGKLNPEGQEEVKTALPRDLLPLEQLPALKERPAAKDLQLSQCRMEKGWFYLGWNYMPEGSVSSRAVDLPAISTKPGVRFSDTARLSDLESHEYYVPSTTHSFRD